MLYKFNETSKKCAFKFALFNSLLTFILAALLTLFATLIFKYYDKVTAIHMSRLIVVEIILNILFYPFSIILILAIRKDKYSWIRVWIKAKVVQASYLFLLNFVMQVYITASLNFLDGLIVLAYTFIVEVFYMEVIIYMNNYHRFKVNEAVPNGTVMNVPSTLTV